MRLIFYVTLVLIMAQCLIIGEEDIKPIGAPYDRSVYGFKLTDGFNAPRGKITHGAWDIYLPAGTPIYATMPGKVIMRINRIAGGFIIVENGPYQTIFCHLSEPAVLTGWEVKRGQLIGYSGSTGESSGPHLHYAITYFGVPVHPQRFFVAQKDNRQG